ncbi:MAG: SDR family NAD(P)-dependent oxidoreductase [Bacteroidales bacterium]|nr:SDR family NAD(P)-dependent oxidoreductase [Bacteroidales bacterium]
MAKKAVIVGATSGIGRAVAELLTEQGWEVGIAGRRMEVLQEMQRKNLNFVATQQIDVTGEEADKALLSLFGKMGTVDLYLHSAGIGYQNPELDEDKELRTVATNALGVTRLVLAAFKYFVSHPERHGHIAVISSIAGTKGLGAAPAYSSTKRFVNHYLECLEQLLRIRGIHHITITDIRPGFVRTPLLSDGGGYPMQMDVCYVAQQIVRGLEQRKSVVTIDRLYRILVAFWRLIPRWLWVRLRIASKEVG